MSHRADSASFLRKTRCLGAEFGMGPTTVAIVLRMLVSIGVDDPALQPRAETRKAADARYPSPVHKALAQGDPRLALQLLEARTTHVAPVDHHSLAGRAYLALADFPAARGELTSAVRMRPNDAGDQFALGQALLGCKAPSMATTRFELAYWHGLDTADLHHNWAVALCDSGQLLGKIACRSWKNEAVSHDPGKFAFRGILLGEIPRRPGKVAVSPPNSAIYHVYRALALEPNRPASLLLSAEIWAEANRHETAIAAYQSAARHLSGLDLARCHRGMAACMLALGRFDEYLDHTRKAMELSDGIDSTELARCHDRIAKALADRGEMPAQIRHMTLAAELKPNAERFMDLADALSQANRFADAVSYFETALEHQPTEAQRRMIQQRIHQATYLAAPR